MKDLLVGLLLLPRCMLTDISKEKRLIMILWTRIQESRGLLPGIVGMIGARITGETGDFPHFVSPRHCSCSWHPRGGTVFVPGSAGARISLTSISTSTSHVTHLMLINLTASILIIALVLLINIVVNVSVYYLVIATRSGDISFILSLPDFS